MAEANRVQQSSRTIDSIHNSLLTNATGMNKDFENSLGSINSYGNVRSGSSLHDFDFTKEASQSKVGTVSDRFENLRQARQS
jgi:hypothetical protein